MRAHSRTRTTASTSAGGRARNRELRTLGPGSARTEVSCRGLPARSRTSSTGFVDRCLRPASQGEKEPHPGFVPERTESTKWTKSVEAYGAEGGVHPDVFA